MKPSRLLIAVTLASTLTACAGPDHRSSGIDIDRSVQARGQSSRVEFIVLHYTSASNARSLALLSGHQVSSHYLITDEATPRVYQLVDESRRAWHAGLSQWYGRTYLNAASIGVEIVNAGLLTPAEAPPLGLPARGTGVVAPAAPGPAWAPYPDAQIDTLIRLLHDIVRRHRIAPQNIIGHSDIAPQRKMDPGPLFPWKKLAEAGLGRWYDEALAARHRAEFERDGLPDVTWIQAQLARVGYDTPRTGKLDAATRNVIAAFQMHYRPDRYDGVPDAETLSILKTLP